MQYASDMAGGMYWLADPKLKLGLEDRRVLGANDATGLNARYSGNSGWQRTSQMLASSTDGAPSLCGVGDTLYALWKGDNDGIYYSSNDQPKIGDWTLPSRIEGTATKTGPAALQLDGNLAVFWNDSETNWVCYSVLRAGAWDPRNIIPGARSDVPPAAANFAGKLWVMFTPPKGTGVYYMTYDTASQRWSLPERLPGTATKDAPSLAVYDGRLYAAWRGHEDDGIYYAATDGGAWTDPARMPQSGTATSVALTTYRDPYDGAERLYAVWFGAGKDGLWWAYFDGYSWCGQANMKPGVPVLSGPSLTRQGERIYCSWQGVGSRVFVNEFLIPA